MSANKFDYSFCPYCSNTLHVIVQEGHERQHCPGCEWTYYPTKYYAPAAVMIEDGEVLLVKRNKQPHKGMWQLPSGFVELKETLLEALHREIKEELDVIVTGHYHVDEKVSTEDPRNLGVSVHFYEISWAGEPVNNEPTENEEIRWFDLSGELPPIAWKTHQTILSQYRQRPR